MDFDFEAVRELTVVKSDPVSGDSWSATLKHVGPTKWDWQVSSGPHELKDTRANAPYIRHLLDTFRTLSVNEEAAKGSLASFGLEPPRFAFRWKAPGPNGEESFEFRVGEVTGHSEAYTMFPQKSAGRVYKAQGAALQMLTHLVNFEYLRLQRFTTFEADDVFEIELKKGAKSFYAQRDGETWTDRKSRKQKKDVGHLVQQLTHARIQRFLDETADTEALAARVLKSPALEIQIGNHVGKKDVIRLAREKDRVLATIESREGAVFELFPKTLETMLSFL
jgi:hypothetical protein